MTDDKELIASLRGKGFSFMEKAADRIEQLVVTNEAMTKERDEAWKRAAYAEKMWGEAEVKLAENEVRLRKAVEGLGRAKASIENGGGGGVVDVVWLDDPYPETLCDFIDATLAEISSEAALNKGESHE